MDLFWLIFGHFLADLPLQGEWLANNKGKEPLFMIGHCVIWTGIISLILLALGIFTPWKLYFLFIGHYMMDSLKCYILKNPVYKNNNEVCHKWQKKTQRWVYGDQLFHLGQLLCVFFF